MQRRRLLLGVGCLPCLGLVGLVLVPRLLPSPPPGLSLNNFHRLYLGMPKHEVEAILGGPGEPSLMPRGGYVCQYLRSWESKEADQGINLRYDDDWRVEGGIYVGTKTGILEELTSKGGPLDRLRRLLPW